MKLAVLTIFPDLFTPFFSLSLVGKAIQRDLLTAETVNPRDFAAPPHYQVDDVPYGGGAGMVMKPEPLVKAIRSTKERLPNARVVYMTPTGTPFTQSSAVALSEVPELIFLCGRYEGIDERVIQLEVNHEISIGDFVLMGGEVAAMAVIEAVVRLLPGVVGNETSLHNESFSYSAEQPLLLEAPQYTRPPEFEGLSVPEILLSGNHAAIKRWRLQEAQRRTKERRPELLSAPKEHS